MENMSYRGENILDLVITSIPDRVKVSEVLKPSNTEISTDHNPLPLIFVCRVTPFQR